MLFRIYGASGLELSIILTIHKAYEGVDYITASSLVRCNKYLENIKFCCDLFGFDDVIRSS